MRVDRLLLSALLSLGLVSSSTFGQQKPVQPPTPTAVSAVASAPATPEILKIEKQVVEGINRQRQQQNLPPLVVADDLTAVARTYSRDMAERHFFAHLDPDRRQVRERVELAGITRWLNVAENIARNKGYDDPGVVAVQGWMSSEAHKGNILDARYRETGIGVWVAPDKTIFFTQIFMTRSSR